MHVGASGPMISCFEEEKIEKIVTGMMVAYNPTSGGNPTSPAKARPIGNAITATENPARRSFPNHSLL